jgi:TolA-binding protein
MTTSSKPTPQQDFDQIKLYLSGAMTAAEQHAFEVRMLEDPFLQDAVEGYAENPDWNWTETVVKKPVNFKWITLLTAGVLGVAVLVYFQFSEKQNPAENQIPLVVQPQQAAVDAESPATIQIEEIRSSDSSVSIMISQAAPTELNSTPEKFVKELDPETWKPIASIEAKKPGSVPVPSVKTPQPEVSNTNQRIYHIKDYKVFDYRGIRLAIEKPAISLGGTPASGAMDADPEPAQQEQKVNYVNYLEQSISLFSQGDYSLALQYFEQIIKTYPDDLNALFYGALCDYYQGDYSGAINKFQRVSTHSVQLFSDESAWYKARALYSNNQKQEAVELMKVISASKSFYNKQAANFLKEKGVIDN